MKLDAKTARRFWSKVERGPGCWRWTAAKTVSGGYGAFGLTPKDIRRAHRLSWELAHGRPIPPGLVVCHKCDEPSCVRPSHLFVGTHADNVHDKTLKGRAARKLNADQVREILDDPRPHRVIGADYGVTGEAIGAIKRREVWRHVQPEHEQLAFSFAQSEVVPREETG